jgi:hypothetical protein
MVARLKALNTFSRLHLSSTYDKKGFSIAIVRVDPISLRYEGWGDEEELGVGRRLPPGSFELHRPHHTPSVLSPVLNVALFSLHALGRFYQRAFETSDVALIDAIAAVAEMRTKLKDEPGTGECLSQAIEIQTRVGTSRGVVEPIMNHRDKMDIVINVRTFRRTNMKIISDKPDLENFDPAAEPHKFVQVHGSVNEWVAAKRGRDNDRTRALETALAIERGFTAILADTLHIMKDISAHQMTHIEMLERIMRMGTTSSRPGGRM